MNGETAPQRCGKTGILNGSPEQSALEWKLTEKEDAAPETNMKIFYQLWLYYWMSAYKKKSESWALTHWPQLASDGERW